MAKKKKEKNRETVTEKPSEKVKRIVMCNDFGNGGLKMIDLKQMQMSFLLHWFMPSRNLGKMDVDSQNIIYVFGVKV